MNHMQEAFALIEAERAKQDEKWGMQRHASTRWLPILVEEVGELSRAILKVQRLDTVEELVQVGAVVVAWLEDYLSEPELRRLLGNRFPILEE